MGHKLPYCQAVSLQEAFCSSLFVCAQAVIQEVQTLCRNTLFPWRALALTDMLQARKFLGIREALETLRKKREDSLRSIYESQPLDQRLETQHQNWGRETGH